MGAARQVWWCCVSRQTSRFLCLFLSCIYVHYLPPALRHSTIIYTFLLSTLQLVPPHGVAKAQLLLYLPFLSLLQLILNQRPLHCLIFATYASHDLSHPFLLFSFGYNFHIHLWYYLHMLPSSILYSPILPLILSYSLTASPTYLPALLYRSPLYSRRHGILFHLSWPLPAAVNKRLSVLSLPKCAQVFSLLTSKIGPLQ